MSALVYQAINAVAADLSKNGIAKSQRNEEGDYSYRGIEDILSALAPLLARHKLCVLPRVLEREAIRGRGGDQCVVLRIAFDLVNAIDGSSHAVESFGEALDDSDKGTAKAMSAAYKAAMLQTFCIPVPQEDADASSSRLNGRSPKSTLQLPEPAEGWDSWSAEAIDVATSCESSEAIDRLLGKRRDQLSALQRSRPDLYGRVGEAIARRLAELQPPEPRSAKSETRRRKPKNQGRADGRPATAQAA